jgi:LmbE family N-acetylglucosaminyl deacetylase
VLHIRQLPVAHRPRRAVKRLLLAALLALAAAALAGSVWLGRLFSEPSAAAVPSLAGALGAQRVLGVFAHPDDEQLVTGLLLRAKQDGAFTALVTATRGEAGEQAPVVARQRDLGAVREAELLKNGFALGVDEQEVWRYPDGGVPEVAQDELVARVEAAMRRYRPDLVVSFWPASGATGHPDHMRVGLAAEIAAQRLAAAGEGPRWLAYALTPRRALARLGGEPGRRIAEATPEATHRMPGEVAAKLRGWQIHASQRDFVRKVWGVPARVLYGLWDEELYRVVELRE